VSVKEWRRFTRLAGPRRTSGSLWVKQFKTLPTVFQGSVPSLGEGIQNPVKRGPHGLQEVRAGEPLNHSQGEDSPGSRQRLFTWARPDSQLWLVVGFAVNGWERTESMSDFDTLLIYAISQY
jgi:hypothetical protein